MTRYVLEIRKTKDSSLKKKKDMKASSFSEALEEEAEYQNRISDRVYTHVREV